MEGNMSAGNMMPGPSSYGSFDLQVSMAMHQQQQQHGCFHHQQQQPTQTQNQGPMVHQPMNSIFPQSVGQMNEREQQPMLQMMDYSKVDHGKISTSEEDDTEDGADGPNKSERGKKAAPWQRVKWTDAMVRLLITVISYLTEGTAELDSSAKKKLAVLQKKGKWKLVSKVMAERNCCVSPQQCEDKFNDLNKRYKRLTEILGRGTSCKVVENPVLLDYMHHISDKVKDDVRKILSSKHLHYEEMCSYHNKNRLHLPADPEVQRSVQSLLKTSDDHDAKRAARDDFDENDQDEDSDDREDDLEENDTLFRDIGGSCFPKRMKQGLVCEDVNFRNSLGPQNNPRRPNSQSISFDVNQVFPEGSTTPWVQKQLIRSRSIQLEEQRLQIQAEMLEIEKQQFKWKRFRKKKDRELDKMRIQNERMKLENERLALELKRRELVLDLN
ncbi:uncharacterized protein LOC103710100 isoform X1 [Phoenix dactylifera]|uniref:Uncharacterized protein LOC103710100 isoform X1 n=1 Tax=Phoenix dactylifera TaxID=42345 RepID=A0A8B8ZCQ3_PHODC|nr:uncharacterized protein LOC103710100 isoform X1 [Phoenix dactylifera]XP_026661628.1 uncharacterized protein LOC103710100 isoform X1 [Phoenix dactylifera]XP_026661629.1 uncharacterized protein LOC103710100 isoform X1 [Phoenix dactylifera]XP_026661630.1 uncharacterized protein LOC103710100 isoform X1 [Phoenix dactylifera]XP_026661632.1 uncharacterized protein LOC103710100 isoform X1 [Phoenix dactylifera]XP_038971875.1 uncharacterized protein LOC103710100 isoform X1 [Phoenix dactylifera]XP_03